MTTALRLLLLVLVLAGTRSFAAEPTGRALPGLAGFDAAMTGLMDKWQIPGASLVVAKEGRLLLARGYGLADRATGAPVEPTSSFRLASLSKWITAVAVLKLHEDGKIGLDDKVLPILGASGPRPDRIADPRVRDITIRQLLQHTGGFDRNESGDPMFQPRAVEAARRQGAPMPASCQTLLRDTLEGGLDFEPGTKYAYSNIGYCILGRVIEIVSGQSYEAFVRARLLDPAGLSGVREGKTLERAPGEVAYYEAPGTPNVDATPGVGIAGRVPAPYGRFAIESLDAVGRWVAAPADYLRFALAIDGKRGKALLRPESVRQMTARPKIPGQRPNPMYYGFGINVRVVGQDAQAWSHSGSLPGVETDVLRGTNGSGWVAAFNTRPKDRGAFRRELQAALAAAGRAAAWPQGELKDEGR